MAIVRDKSGNGDHRHDYAQQTFAGRVTPTANTASITPSDTAFVVDAAGNRALTKVVAAEVGGDIAYENENGLAATAKVADGQIAYIRARRIKSTGTTATGLTAYF